MNKQLPIQDRINNAFQSIIASVLIVALLAACTTTDPVTGEEKTTNTATGAIFGAIAGALLGAASSSKKDRKKGMILGAGIGVLTGATVGDYMDKQEEELRSKLKGTGVSITRDENNIILNMPSNITFDTDKYEIKQEFMKTLDAVVVALKEYESTLVTVTGHTDSTGSNEYNQSLSEKRALTISNKLLSSGIHQKRLAAIGLGETKPIADNSTVEGRAQNRRVEITLEPVVSSEEES